MPLLAVLLFVLTGFVLLVVWKRHVIFSSESMRPVTSEVAKKAQREAKRRAISTTQTISKNDLTLFGFSQAIAANFQILCKRHKLVVGQDAPDFIVHDADGRQKNFLSFVRDDRPLVVNFGSYT